MDHLASIAEMAHTEENEQEEMMGVENKHKSNSSPSLKNTRKRNSDSDMYLSAEEKIDVNILISSHDSFIFPRDDQQNYICVFQGCTKPILRGLNTEEYFSHLRAHGSNSDRLLSNMLRRVPNEQGDKKAKRRRANSTNSYSTSNIVPKKQKESFDGAFEKEDSNGSPDGGSPRSPDSKRTNSTDEYNIPLKPSSRGVQLRDQMLRYGLHLFRIDSEGKYICFFDECSLHMMTNFSRHIAKHEKNGDKIKQELLHLCSPSIVQQQLHQHPNLSLQSPSPPSHSLSLSSNPQIPLQQLLLRHQQETLQLQQQQQHQQQMNIQSAAQLEQLQNFHSMQFHQLQMQHNQQLQMFHQNLSSASPVSVSPTHQQISQQTPSHFVQQQQQHQEANKRPKSNVPELSLLSQVRDESDLALMRTQISKMLEDSSRNHPNFSALSSPSPSPQQKRSLSLAYYNSPSMQESPSLRHPYHPSPSSMNIPSPARSLHSPVIFSPRMQNENNNNNFNQPHSQENPQRQRQRQRSLSPSSSPSASPSPSPSSSSPSSPSSSPSSSEIKWIFPKNKPVLSK